ncbi:agamous-like MADS-box protein AGL62 [Apium graveolens]|uniref:agamous-like MADS-box protein AGL62 n=1 Tax=Apium graveolens TaxID=4045 RepID=UPI003D7AC1BC
MMRKTSGRKKIEIKRIENTANRLVAFSKRRPRLFNKASELCVLTGAEMAILVQSEGGRVFALGHPTVDSVIHTYLGKYTKICKELEVEKNKSSNVGESEGFWWENSLENLEADELEIFINSLEQLKFNVTKKADELRTLSASPSSDNITDGLLDEFLLDNIDVANEDLMMSAVDPNDHGDSVSQSVDAFFL